MPVSGMMIPSVPHTVKMTNSLREVSEQGASGAARSAKEMRDCVISTEGQPGQAESVGHCTAIGVKIQDTATSEIHSFPHMMVV